MINEGVGKVIGSQANPELLIHSINIDIMRRQDVDEINAKYLEVALKLQTAGAEGILICANTPHMVYEYVQPQIQIPILHIADAVGREASRLGIQKLGILGNKPTMTGSFIPGPLQERYGIATLLPEAHCLGKAHYFVSKELTQGKFTEAAKDFFLNQIRMLKDRGAEGIILGCTELPLLIHQQDVDIPALATTELHAEEAIDFILERGAYPPKIAKPQN
jgi:aspartate racemase